MSQVLQGKAALITGGGTGIGRAIAETFAREGAAVAITGRRKGPLDEVVAALKSKGAKALAVAGDVSNKDDARRMVAETVAAFGALHILVNNAGVGRFGNLEQTSEADIDLLVDVNLKGPLYLLRAALPHLKKHKDSGGAAVLNISSSVTSLAVKNFAAYSAAKAGLDQLTKCCALDFGPDQVRVNAILPGVVETPIFETMLPKAAVGRAMESMAKLHPLGRVGQPEDVAEMALFLCGPQAGFITGALVNVDGGVGLGSNA